jgi:hypothetical protein
MPTITTGRDRLKSVKRDSEILRSVFVPDVLTPAQYFDSIRGDSADVPLKRLMMAVLQDAIRCFQSNPRNRSRFKELCFREVTEWIFHTPGDGPFSFVSVCDVLGIFPEYLRMGLAEWERGHAAGLPAPRLGRRAPVLGSGQIKAGHHKTH